MALRKVSHLLPAEQILTSISVPKERRVRRILAQSTQQQLTVAEAEIRPPSEDTRSKQHPIYFRRILCQMAPPAFCLC
jgi:hypothetical protein